MEMVQLLLRLLPPPRLRRPQQQPRQSPLDLRLYKAALPLNVSCTVSPKDVRLLTGTGKEYYKVQDGDTCAGIVDKYHTFTLQNL